MENHGIAGGTAQKKAAVFQKNMEAARQFFPGMEKRIADAGQAENFAAETAVSGEPTARLGGRYLHSARDPEREAARLVAASAGENAGNIIVLLGFALGYAAEAAAALPSEPLVVVVEKRPELLRAALECRDLSGLFSKRVVFVLGDDPSAVTAALPASGGKAAVIQNIAVTAADADFYGEAARHIGNWRTKEAVNAATLRRFGKRWVRNQAANMEAIRDLPGISRLAGHFDFPALLLAAGPSLNAIAGKLKRLRERCIVVAVDTALRFLRREGVAPDFAVSVDPQYWNARHIDRCLPAESVFVTEAAVYPSVLRERRSAGRTFLCGSIYPLSRFVEERVDPKGRLGAGGSVASSAWDFAASLVCRAASPSIFIAGLDLAFPRMETHYSGALFEERAHASSCRFLPAETQSFRALRDGEPFFARAADGSPVLTDKRLNLYASWFENRVATAKNYNSSRLSGSGLAIKGMKTASVDEILALPPCRSEISSRIERVLSDIFLEWDRENEREGRVRRYDAACAALESGLETARLAALSMAQDAETFELRDRLPDDSVKVSFEKKMAAANDALRQSGVYAAARFLLQPDSLSVSDCGAEDFLREAARTCRDLADSAGFALSAFERGRRYNSLNRR
ncbi:MAG: DUF115 domain-containing protein [Spirochaetaceae bacterium]|nr:DUF115 domain-containing protein [Spirochaetaceae bacterium]